MAAFSVIATPSCTSAGTLPIGLTARNSGDFMLVPNSSCTSSYGKPVSSSIQRVMRARDIGLV